MNRLRCLMDLACAIDSRLPDPTVLMTTLVLRLIYEGASDESIEDILDAMEALIAQGDGQTHYPSHRDTSGA